MRCRARQGHRARMGESVRFERLTRTAREKNSSMLASCAMCAETCLKTMKWRGKRSRICQNILKWLSIPSEVMKGCSDSGAFVSLQGWHQQQQQQGGKSGAYKPLSGTHES